jgi:hypothetical protein
VTAILALIVGVIVLAGLRWIFLKVKPYKACPTCKGRGHCIRCGYTGKVLRAGAGLIHPELRKK